MRVHTITTGLVSALFITLRYAGAQGSLTPPGVPAETMKTLEQVEPRTDVATVAGDATYHHVISQPGSYYMSGNLEVSKTSGIYISTNGVTLDLNGFEISRASGSGGYGVLSVDAKRTSICNGTIIGFGYGIAIWGNSLVEKLAVSECSIYGIDAGPSSRLINCQAHENSGSGIYARNNSILNGCWADGNNGEYGIYAGDHSILSGCTVSYSSGTYGIYAGVGSSLKDCTASKNSGNGFVIEPDSSLSGCVAYYNGSSGILSGEGCTISDCAAYHNSSNGIVSASGCTISDCAARENDNDGIVSGYGSTISDCAVRLNGNDGIFLHAGGTISGCSALSNSGDGIDATYAIIRDCMVENNRGNGIKANYLSTIVRCKTVQNDGDGINAYDLSNIDRCTAFRNEGDGIRITTDSQVTDCICRESGWVTYDGAGIHATSSGNRIDGNTVANNDRGIDVDDSGNVIVGNYASGNDTNYVIVANNKVGVIVSAPDSDAINGSTGGAGVGSTDPSANFSY